MFIDYSKHNRSTLTAAEREYLELIVPIGTFISEQTAGKAETLRGFRNPVGIYSSIIIADIIHSSQFGKHPVSLKRHDNKPANNLALLEPDRFYYGPVVYHRGKEYRSYKDIRAYAINHSDIIAFSKLFDGLLMEPDLDEQIAVYVKNKSSARGYRARIKTVIDLYNLTEFDKWSERKNQTQHR